MTRARHAGSQRVQVDRDVVVNDRNLVVTVPIELNGSRILRCETHNVTNESENIQVEIDKISLIPLLSNLSLTFSRE